MEERIDDLIQSAYEALRNRECERALDLSDELLSRRHSSGFEVKARALWSLERCDEAIACLREGIERAPSVSILWHFLGCFLSDLGSFEEAVPALQRAVNLSDVHRSNEMLNLAIVLRRKGDLEESLRVLRTAVLSDSENPTLVQFYELEAGLLMEMERFAEGLDVVEKAFEQFEKDGLSEDLDTLIGGTVQAGELLSQLYVLAGVGVLETGGPAEEVEGLALQSIALDQCSLCGMELLRRAKPRTDADAKQWSVMVRGQGTLPDTDEVLGFFVMVNSVAITAQQAFEDALILFPPELRDRLTIQEATVGEHAPMLLIGPYSRSSYQTFPLDDNED